LFVNLFQKVGQERYKKETNNWVDRSLQVKFTSRYFFVLFLLKLESTTTISVWIGASTIERRNHLCYDIFACSLCCRSV